MHYKLVDEKPKTFILVFETNDELARGLKDFASEQGLPSQASSHWCTFIRETRMAQLANETI